MTLEIRIDSNLPGLQDALNKAPQKISQRLDQLARRAAGEVVRRAKSEAPQADGVLTNSLNAQRITLGEWVAGTPVVHAAHVENGSEGGGHVPAQTLLDWIKRKRIVSRKSNVTQNQLVFLIQRAIYHHGTKPNPFMQRTATAMSPRVKTIFDDGLRGLVNEVLT